jgi:hypothetical protein
MDFGILISNFIKIRNGFIDFVGTRKKHFNTLMTLLVSKIWDKSSHWNTFSLSKFHSGMNK